MKRHTPCPLYDHHEGPTKHYRETRVVLIGVARLFFILSLFGFAGWITAVIMGYDQLARYCLYGGGLSFLASMAIASIVFDVLRREE